MWGVLSDERAGLSFTIAAGPRQRSYSRVRVPWDYDHILLSQIRQSELLYDWRFTTNQFVLAPSPLRVKT
jgi:hypothetical protein